MIATPPGYIKNFQIIGHGGIYDSTKCLYRQGTWTNNQLNGETVYTDFFNPIVNIKVGPYTSNKPNGTISEYTFNKTEWDAFIADPPAGIAATKKVNVYSSGALTSTTSTETVNISGHVDKNSAGNVIAFTFVEVAAA
jgi:hypothetical protein